ncbi:hypothetical protein [Brevibacillus brevis]|uniref:hypothetical protein n=1 Tax=Brevibacillus brevis TaxID=1393 RepID=UPI000D0FF394|nr:hypothetical protein [Brevibacillus brevis]PSJ58662.1 hypothetical protein C7J99_32015 [Brevibacillus brevis]RED20868.1 hypothetical protein DES34_1316 [Brevibacillus brevis]GEC93757.1 hypothetical protein BBR01nite_60880 [Brevibacillus brevis]VEF87247.1 Uncharacterised protein [Brevibacillus brevis]
MQVLSLGAGVQSTTMLLMAAHSEFDSKPDFAVFADTGWEPAGVMYHFFWLKAKVKKMGIPVHIATRGDIREDLLRASKEQSRSVNMPFFVKGSDGRASIIRRQCTEEYKINVVNNKIRELLGYQKGERMKHQITKWMGISTDEFQRMKPGRHKWETMYYPLIEKNMSRGDCLLWMNENGYPRPPKSSCIGCPFHNDKMWLDMQESDPESFRQAVEFEREIQKNGLRQLNNVPFLHRSLIPLDQIDFKARLEGKQMDLINDFINECEGMCGV